MAASGVLIAAVYAWQKRVLPTLWAMVCNAAALVAYTWVFVWLDARWWWKVLILIALSPVFALANSALRRQSTVDMARRGDRATTLVHHLMTSEETTARFALYLRPFSTTDRLSGQVIQPELLGEIDRKSHVDVETLLTRAMPRGYLIALGRPDDISQGAARVATTDDQWREVVLRLIEVAEFLVVLPFANAGTRWEIEQIRDRRLLGKTVFLMPETVREQPSGLMAPLEDDNVWDVGVRRYAPSEHGTDVAEEWARARQALAALGLELPPYSTSGALLTLEPDTGQVRDIVPAPLALLTRRQSFIRTVLPRLGRSAGQPPAPDELLETLEVAAYPNIRSREWVLTLAIDLYACCGDATRAVAVAGRLDKVVRGRPRLLDSVLAGLLDELPTLDKDGRRRVACWLEAADVVTGHDRVLARELRIALAGG